MNIKELKAAKKMGTEEKVREIVAEIKTKINNNPSSGKVRYQPDNPFNIGRKVLDKVIEYFEEQGFEAQWTSSIIIIVEW